MVGLLQGLEGGQGDEILVPDLLLCRPADRGVDRAQTSSDLVFKIDGIVDHVDVGMRAPGAERQLVLLPRDLHRLIAGLVAEIVGKFRALGAGNEVEHGIVVRQRLLLRQAEVGKHLPELVVRDVGLVVEQRAVIQHDHALLGHHLGSLERQLFLVQLVGDDKILKIQHGHAAAEGLDAKAGDELRRRFGDGDDLPALVLLEFLEYPADERRLAGGRPAGQYDPRDLFCQRDRSFAFL